MNKNNNYDKDKAELSPEDRKDFKDMPKFLKSSISWCFRNGISTALFIKLVSNGMNPFEAKRLLTERTMGLRTNSIIANPLYFPDSGENEGSLRFQNTSAGLWNVYDFKKEFRLKVKMPYSGFGKGVDLLFFPIEDIVNKDSDKNIETPDGLFDLFHFDHLVHFSKMRVQEALDYGAIEEVTYQEAYKRVGNSGWERDVEELGIADKTVYQVTPKGSTLIIPSKKGGDKTPPLPDSEIEGAKGLEPAYAN